MARKTRAIPIRQHYSKDLKCRVIYQAYTLKKTSTEIAIDLDMPLRVVQRVKKTWREIGEVCRDRKYIGRSPMMSPNHTKVRISLTQSRVDMTYLDEIQEQLFLQHDLDVSLSTISRTMKILGLSSKKLSVQAAERCADARRAFIMEIGDEPADRIVCADESAVNILTSYRRNGWSRKRCCFVRGTRSACSSVTVSYSF
ncbi:hypothetical protein GGX14DRAFT_369858 [Mycena pura]|uniref:Transposase Tc1-like domain-containing protein n=1 Tax=Mycena pura TaxID=153505 RepID=A0AAD6Y757_9AGAR|nr:hypothetical protein GGX14DRAFT_369858 [Mycena pura]